MRMFATLPPFWKLLTLRVRAQIADQNDLANRTRHLYYLSRNTLFPPMAGAHTRHESEIVVVVIRSIAVDMVDNLICSQPPSDALFHDYNVLAATFVFYA